MGASDDLVAFIRARLDEQQQRAIRMRDGVWPVSVHVVPMGDAGPADPSISIEGFGAPKPYGRVWYGRDDIEWGHVVHDTSIEVWSEDVAVELLRGVEADRLILAEHFEDPGQPGSCGRCSQDDTDSEGELHRYQLDWPCRTVRILGSKHSGHQDYRKEWCP